MPPYGLTYKLTFMTVTLFNLSAAVLRLHYFVKFLPPSNSLLHMARHQIDYGYDYEDLVVELHVSLDLTAWCHEHQE
jgi:hypothetical protein